jgi:DNA-binding response OmpR family regulator
MKVLIADDDLVTRELLEAQLARMGCAVVSADNGASALQCILDPGGPRLAILDWMMPGASGVEICRQLRASSNHPPLYLILLTARETEADLVEGLDSGADDYVRKPCSFEELSARVRVGMRVLKLETALAERVRELEESLAQIKQLTGLLPICVYCKRVRDDANYWRQVEAYISSHSALKFTHSICPECYDKAICGNNDPD